MKTIESDGTMSCPCGWCKQDAVCRVTFGNRPPAIPACWECATKLKTPYPLPGDELMIPRDPGLRPVMDCFAPDGAMYRVSQFREPPGKLCVETPHGITVVAFEQLAVALQQLTSHVTPLNGQSAG